MSPQAQELKINLDAIYQAIEYEGDEDAARIKALTVFADWAQGIYGSGPDTDVFIICPRRTDGTVALDGNDGQLINFLAELGQSQGVMVFKAILDYARKGMPMNLAPFTPARVAFQPTGERAFQVFDKDTMYKQRCTLRDICDRDGQRICTVSTANRDAILPANVFTSRPPDHVFFNQRFAGDWYRGTITEVYALRAVVLIPKDRIRRALQFEKDITDAISDLKRMESATPDSPEWRLPVCLKKFAIGADCKYLLVLLDVSVAQGKFRIWEEVMGILCRFKTVDEIGTSRIFASVKEFSFKRVQPFLDTLVTQLTTVEDVTSFTVGIKESSGQDKDKVDRWCAHQGNSCIIKILGSNEKTLPSLVQYGFVKGLPLLSNFVKTLSHDKTASFTFWLSLVSHLDHQWQSINSPSFTGDPLRELHFMLDCCISAMIPLIGEGVVYTLEAPDVADDIRHNAEVHVKRTVIVIEICLRFSPVRCNDVLFDVFAFSGDVQTKFDLFYHPLARSLRSLLEQYEFTIFQPPFFAFYRFLVGMYLYSYLGGEFTRRGQPPLATMVCTKKVVCDRCEAIDEFLYSGEQSRELIVMNKEWTHLRYIFPKLKDLVFPPTVTTGGLWKTIRLSKRPQPHLEAAKEFLRVIGDEEEISRLMEPLEEEVRNALNFQELFDFECCLRLPNSERHGSPPLLGGSLTA